MGSDLVNKTEKDFESIKHIDKWSRILVCKRTDDSIRI